MTTVELDAETVEWCREGLGAEPQDAYGLTDEERALMWRTAPPRMPIPPPPDQAGMAGEAG